MAHARVVRLRRVGEQARRTGGQAIELAHDGLAVDPQRRRGQRQVGRFAARGPRELADAVDRVVVVGGEEQAAAVTERVGLADQAQRRAGVGREHDVVLVGRGVQEPEDRVARRLREAGRGVAGRAGRVRIAEHAGAEQVLVFAELRFRVQGAARVVEVDLVELVEPRVLARPQRLDGVAVPVGVGREAGRRAPRDSRSQAARHRRPMWSRPAASVVAPPLSVTWVPVATGHDAKSRPAARATDRPADRDPYGNAIGSNFRMRLFSPTSGTAPASAV